MSCKYSFLVSAISHAKHALLFPHSIQGAQVCLFILIRVTFFKLWIYGHPEVWDNLLEFNLLVKHIYCATLKTVGEECFLRDMRKRARNICKDIPSRAKVLNHYLSLISP